MKLAKAFRDLREAFAETQNAVRDIESEVKRLRMEWGDHLDYTERAVGRWSKREQLDKKRAKEAETAHAEEIDVDELIRSGRMTSGPGR